MSFTPPPLSLQPVFPLVRQFVDRILLAAPFFPPGTIATSWYRDLASNQRVGGLPDSQHLAALAADIDAGSPEANRRVSEALFAAGLVVVGAQTHVHVQAFPRDFEVVARLRARGFAV